MKTMTKTNAVFGQFGQEQLLKDKEFKKRLDSLHTTPGTPVQEFENVHVDIWYDNLSHLTGQHVWVDNKVYIILKDQDEGTDFDIENAELIVENVLLYEDRNMTDSNLEYAKELKVGDLFLYNNSLFSLPLEFEGRPDVKQVYVVDKLKNLWLRPAMKIVGTDNFPDNGFVIAASCHERFYTAAIDLAESIKLFWPEAHITIFVSHKEWIKEEHWEHVDWIESWGVPNHIRAKLWALSCTPYRGKTCYLDCDMVCEHEDIENVFDQLPDDLDLLFTKIRPYNAKLTKLSNTEEMTAHCGMFIYRNNPQTLQLMDSWYGHYLWQQDEMNDIGSYPNEARKWDTFTMWNLLTYSDHGVKWEEDLHVKWNFVNGHNPDELEGEEIVLYHYTIPEHEIYLKNK